MSELFVLACAGESSGGGVYKFSLTSGGELKKTGCYPCDRPMYGAIDGGELFVLLRAPFSENENGGYFKIDKNLKNPSDIKNTLGKCPCHLSADKDVYVANYLSGNLSKNGAESVAHTGRGVNLPRQDVSHTHFAGFTPDKKYLLCCDLGLDTVFVYDRNLSLVSAAKAPCGYGVRHLVFDKSGKRFYAINELYPSIGVFGFNSGVIEYLNTTPLLVNDKNSTAAAIRLSGDGKTLYASVRGENAIYLLSVNGGVLSVTDKFDCGGVSPRDFDVIGDYIVVANEGTGVCVIKADDKKVVFKEELPNPLNVIKI